MNHFISGIIKIVLLEASVALLLLDLVAGDRFARARARAHGVLAGLMVFAWANYGALRPGFDVGLALSSVPVILACGWLVSFAFGRERDPAVVARLPPAVVARARPLAVALVVLLSGAWVGGGVAAGKLPLVHQWEQFHFYLGAKYQREVGWFNLYKAVILADRETVNALGAMPTTRELSTFAQVPVEAALRDAPAVRARFSDAQWQAFKDDWVTMARLWPINWTNVLNDHGNSNSPAWSLLAAPIAKLVPLSARGQALLGWLDMLLMLGLWLVAWQTFGHRVASVGLLLWATPPIVFDYLSGSFLRWDWLLAVGLAACALKQRRAALAGGLFGFALATKLFPLFFGVALGLRALFAWRETGRFERHYARFAVAAVAVGGGAVLLSAALFGVDAWREYARRIQVAQVEKFYAIQYSFRSVFLQHAALPSQAWTQTLWPGELAQLRPDVDLCGARADEGGGDRCALERSACGDGHGYRLDCEATGTCTCLKDGAASKRFGRELPCVQSGSELERLFEQECGFPHDYSLAFLLGRLLFSAFVLVLLRRAEDVDAFLLGPLLVFTWLTVNMYYWNMLGLLAMGLLVRAERPRQWPALAMLIGLHVVFMVFYLYQHMNRALTEGYAVAWMLTVLVVGTALAELRAWRTGGAAAQPDGV